MITTSAPISYETISSLRTNANRGYDNNLWIASCRYILYGQLRNKSRDTRALSARNESPPWAYHRELSKAHLRSMPPPTSPSHYTHLKFLT